MASTRPPIARLLLTGMAALCSSSIGHAQGGSDAGLATPPAAATGDRGAVPPVDLREDYADHFLHYEPLMGRPKPARASAPVLVVSPARSEPPRSPASGASRVDIQWLQTNYPLLQEQALNDPSPVNARALAYVQRIILDKASRYANAMHDAVMADPLINENSRVPYASMGATAVRNADLQAQATAVRELARMGGLLVFVDSECRFCKAQLPILDYLHHEYGIEYLLVSIDGGTLPGSKTHAIRDTGVFAKLGLKITPSTVFVPKPSPYQGSDPNTYLIVSQGFYAADDMVKQISFAGYQKHLLAAATMRDLAVWDQGILETSDLATLELDPSKPETIPQQIEPLLMKRY